MAPALRVYCSGTGQLVGEMQGFAQRCIVTYELSGRPRVFSGSAGGTLRIHDATRFTTVANPKGHADAAVTEVMAYYVPAGPRLVSAGSDGRIQVLEGDRGKPLSQLRGSGGGVTALASFVDGGRQRLVAGFEAGIVSTLDPESGETLQEIEAHRGPVYALSCFLSSTSGRPCVVSGSGDQKALVLDALKGVPLQSLEGHERRVCSVLTYRDEDSGLDRIVTASYDGTVRIWDCDSGEIRRELHGHASGITCMAAYSTKEGAVRLVTGSFDRSLKIWDPEAGGAVTTFGGPPTDIYRLILFPPDAGGDEERLILAEGGGEVRLWNMPDATRYQSLFTEMKESKLSDHEDSGA
jgi:WD40 repeat protein